MAQKKKGNGNRPQGNGNNSQSTGTENQRRIRWAETHPEKLGPEYLRPAGELSYQDTIILGSKYLARHEGCKPCPYLDEYQNPTIGVGTLIFPKKALGDRKILDRWKAAYLKLPIVGQDGKPLTDKQKAEDFERMVTLVRSGKPLTAAKPPLQSRLTEEGIAKAIEIRFKEKLDAVEKALGPLCKKLPIGVVLHAVQAYYQGAGKRILPDVQTKFNEYIESLPQEDKNRINSDEKQRVAEYAKFVLEHIKKGYRDRVKTTTSRRFFQDGQALINSATSSLGSLVKEYFDKAMDFFAEMGENIKEGVENLFHGGNDETPAPQPEGNNNGDTPPAQQSETNLSPEMLDIFGIGRYKSFTEMLMEQINGDQNSTAATFIKDGKDAGALGTEITNAIEASGNGQQTGQNEGNSAENGENTTDNGTKTTENIPTPLIFRDQGNAH